MQALKSVGQMAFGLACVLLMLAVGAAFVFGATWAAIHLTYYAMWTTFLTLMVCVVLLLPLALFRTTRIASVFGFYIASVVFGACTWLAGLLVTLMQLGGLGVFIGLVLGVLGVVPLGIIGALVHSAWRDAVLLVVGIALTFATRGFSLWLASLVDRQEVKAAY
jgi:hypothetical protein